MSESRTIQVHRRDGFKCVYCQRGGFEVWPTLEIDHFNPRSKDGSDEIENLVTACRTCNQMKGSRVYATIEAARKDLLQWWEQIRIDYNKLTGDTTTA